MKIPDYNKKIKQPTYLKMQEEIERLKEEYMILQNASDEVEEKKDNEIERLNNIINEVREYIEENKQGTDCCGDTYIGLGEEEINDILEILDKENNNEDN